MSCVGGIWASLTWIPLLDVLGQDPKPLLLWQWVGHF